MALHEGISPHVTHPAGKEPQARFAVPDLTTIPQPTPEVLPDNTISEIEDVLNSAPVGVYPSVIPDEIEDIYLDARYNTPQHDLCTPPAVIEGVRTEGKNTESPLEERERMKMLLETLYKVVFHERKRERLVPTVDPAWLAAKIGYPEHAQTIARFARDIELYIQGQAITDTWGNNDSDVDGRNKWERDMMEETDGNIFKEVYKDPNQLPANALSHMNNALQLLGMFLHEFPEHQTILSLAEQLRHETEKYSTKTDNEKITIAQSYVDAGIAALEIAFPDTPRRIMKVT